MKAARIIKTKEPLEIKDVNIPKPKSDQVLVKVESAGVCHSDLHLWEGGYAGLSVAHDDGGDRDPA